MRSDAAQLACIVLCYKGQPSVVEAVRSLVEQHEPIELVVVNSGGSDPSALLHDAGFDVPVISCEERLFVGAARNVGIGATTAPFVAFLAADCLAEPGWVRGRLACHQAGALAVTSAVTNANRHSVIGWTAHVMVYARRMPDVPERYRIDYGLSYARTLFDQFGLFRPDLRVGEDSDFNRRIAPTPVVWASDVRCAHLNPTTLIGLLWDQYQRGQRRVYAARLSGDPSPQWTQIRKLILIPREWKLTWRSTQRRDRVYVLGTLIFLGPAWLARTLGILFADPLRDESDSSA